MASKTNGTVKIVRFDWAMKSLLRDKANFDILEGFLHSLLGEELTILEIIESESNPDSDGSKYNCVDLLAKDANGRKVLIEIQNERQSDYIERMLFGTSKLVIESIDKGQKYRDIPKIISIHILYFNLGQGTDYVYSGTTELRGVHTDEPLLVSEHFIDEEGNRALRLRDVFPEYHVINVERFHKMDQEDLEMLDQWVYLFKQSEVRGDFDAPGMATARQKLAYLKMSEAERQRYDRFVDAMVQEMDVMETAHQDGVETGIKKGIEQGKLEERRQLIANLRENGFSIEQIAQGTGLTEAAVSSLLADKTES